MGTKVQMSPDFMLISLQLTFVRISKADLNKHWAVKWTTYKPDLFQDFDGKVDHLAIN